jgi:hypothetical protein
MSVAEEDTKVETPVGAATGDTLDAITSVLQDKGFTVESAEQTPDHADLIVKDESGASMIIEIKAQPATSLTDVRESLRAIRERNERTGERLSQLRERIAG